MKINRFGTARFLAVAFVCFAALGGPPPTALREKIIARQVKADSQNQLSLSEFQQTGKDTDDSSGKTLYLAHFSAVLRIEKDCQWTAFGTNSQLGFSVESPWSARHNKPADEIDLGVAARQLYAGQSLPVFGDAAFAESSDGWTVEALSVRRRTMEREETLQQNWNAARNVFASVAAFFVSSNRYPDSLAQVGKTPGQADFVYVPPQDKQQEGSSEDLLLHGKAGRHCVHFNVGNRPHSILIGIKCFRIS